MNGVFRRSFSSIYKTSFVKRCISQTTAQVKQTWKDTRISENLQNTNEQIENKIPNNGYHNNMSESEKNFCKKISDLNDTKKIPALMSEFRKEENHGNMTLNSNVYIAIMKRLKQDKKFDEIIMLYKNFRRYKVNVHENPEFYSLLFEAFRENNLPARAVELYDRQKKDTE
eukprot:UN32279